MDPELNKEEKQNNEAGYVSKKPNVPKPGEVVKPTISPQASPNQKANTQPFEKEKSELSISEDKTDNKNSVPEKKQEIESIGGPKEIIKPESEKKLEKKEEIDFEDEIKGKKENIEEKPKKSKKPLIVGAVLVVLLVGLGGGIYFLYSSGILSDFLGNPMGVLIGNGNGGTQVEEESIDDAVVESSPSEEESNVDSLDYLEDSLKDMESTVNSLQENYRLDESLNLEDSTF